DREDLNQLWTLVKESLNNRPASSDKEMELYVELKRLYEPDVKDQLWTHTQNMMHASVEFMEVPLAEEVPTASEESSHCQKKRDATAEKIALLLKSISNCQSMSYDSYAKDSYEVLASAATTDTASDGTGKKKEMTVTVTTEDMQKRKNDVKARTTLLLSLSDEHQLRF
nr:hypothetical protein [Tanacetum cinerariifolium]